MFNGFIKKIKNTINDIIDVSYKTKITDRDTAIIKYLESEEMSLDRNVVVNYSIYGDPEIVGPDDKPLLFILDDLIDSWELYLIDFETINVLYNKNPLEDFCIIKCFGADAGFKAMKFIYQNPDINISKGIIDITLGYGIKLVEGVYVEHDGVDVVVELLKHNSDIDFIFSTSHTFNRDNSTMAHYYNKFEEKTGLEIEDVYVNKNFNRTESIYKLLYGKEE